MTQLAEHDDITAVIQADVSLADSTKAKYRRAVEHLRAAGVNPFDRAALKEYAASLSKTGRAHLKAAITKYTADTADSIKAGSLPETIGRDLAALNRLAAMANTIKVSAAKGQKLHHWLSQNEVKRLLDTCCADDLKGKRDRVVIGLLVAAGLRREELAGLTFDQVTTQPVKGKLRTVLSVTGKGARDRSIPVSDKLAAALDEWGGLTAASGHVARSIDKGGNLGGSLSAVAIFHIVRAAGKAIGKPDLAPHDLRRTYAQIGYEAGIPVTQISRLLGHSSITTTQRYLNLDLDLESTVSDFVPF